MDATIGTFEEYLEALRPCIKQWVVRQVGVNFQDKEKMRHPFLSWADLEQECALKLWKVYEQHRESKPWQDLCRIGGAAIRGCILDVIDRTLVRGQAGASVVSLANLLADKSDLEVELSFEDDLIDGTAATPEQETEAAEQATRIAALLEADERLIFRELIAMSNRTLEIFENIRRTANRAKPTNIVRVEAIATALEVPVKAVFAVAAKLRDLGRETSDAPRY